MACDYTIEASYPGRIVAGIDEAGRGPLAGPVVAAAVILNAQALPHGVNDSKQLSREQREHFHDIIHATAIVGVGISSVEEIDFYNILGATKLAMLRAYEALGCDAHLALIDGNQLPSLPCEMKGVVGGDGLSLSIAAASVVAKVTRDRIMAQLALEHPEYGWEHNAGYGTRKHYDGLARAGVTPHHRRSFAPIRKLLEEMQAA